MGKVVHSDRFQVLMRLNIDVVPAFGVGFYFRLHVIVTR